MDTTQEELVAALVRRLQGRSGPVTPRRIETITTEPVLEVLIELDDDGAELLDR